VNSADAHSLGRLRGPRSWAGGLLGGGFFDERSGERPHTLSDLPLVAVSHRRVRHRSLIRFVSKHEPAIKSDQLRSERSFQHRNDPKLDLTRTRAKCVITVMASRDDRHRVRPITRSTITRRCPAIGPR
jgi:hypothetical protein